MTTIEEIKAESQMLVDLILFYKNQRKYENVAYNPTLENTVREICQDLLDAAEVQDMGGCPLCQS